MRPGRMQVQSLEFIDLTYTTPSGIAIFQNSTFAFPSQGLYWVQSKSGEGKSTLLRLLAGVVLAESGKYQVNGQDVYEMSFSEFTPYRLQIGLSFDFGGLINNRTLLQNLSLILEYHQIFAPEEIREIVLHWLKLFDVEEFADVRPSAVPGAVRKVICVLRAFVHEPRILLLDDPTTGLRKEARLALIKTIQESRKNRPDRLILLATEDQELIRELQPSGTIKISSKKLQLDIEHEGRVSA